MISIQDQIEQKLQTHAFSYPVKVQDAYSKAKPQYPLITIDESGNRELLSLGEVERYAKLTYRIEVYTRDEVDEDKIIPARKVARHLAHEMDQVLRTELNLTRVGDPVSLPYTTDTTITRYILTYSATIDTLTNYIYKGDL